MNHMTLTIEDRKSKKREDNNMAGPHAVVLFDGKLRSIVSSRGFFLFFFFSSLCLAFLIVPMIQRYPSIFQINRPRNISTFVFLLLPRTNACRLRWHFALIRRTSASIYPYRVDGKAYLRFPFRTIQGVVVVVVTARTFCCSTVEIRRAMFTTNRHFG